MSTSRLPFLSDANVYNDYIGIPPPRHADFDVRDFVDNMAHVRLKMPPFRLGFYQLALLESGTGVVSQDGVETSYRRFSLFFNQPGQIIYWDISSDWSGYYVNLAESYYTVPLNEFPALPSLPFFAQYTPAIQLQETEAQQMLTLFGQLIDARELPTTHFDAISKGLVNGILAYALRYYEHYVDAERAAGGGEDPASRFFSLVRQRVTTLGIGLPAASLGVRKLAEELFVSPQHLSSVVKKAMGMSPTAYIQHLLMEEAKKLLRATELPIGEIADQLAFRDPSYFSRLFRNRVGCSPGAYRKGNTTP